MGDIEHTYKQMKLESQKLASRERELTARISEMKKLKEANRAKAAKVAQLEAELAQLLEDM
ncbi:MAG: hypothetical protein ACXABY_04645 [Candidatus Thorarchaeota archaeon]|jgi:hypothetical protein